MCDEKNGYAFAGVENFLWENFLPGLFFRKFKSLPSITGTLSTTPANKSFLGLQNLVTSADEKPLSSQRAITELIRAVMGESEFPTTDYLQEVN